MKRFSAVTALALIVVIMLGSTALASAAQTFPAVIPLPNGFRPEGIAIGKGTDFYVGSLGDGAIFGGDLRTGEGDVFVQGQEGRMAVGLAFDERSGYLFVSGGATGMAFVYDTRTGEEVAAVSLAPAGQFINDVVVTNWGAYFTNSSAATLYKVRLLAGGRLPDPVEVEELPLTGDWQQVPDAFNANGIEAGPGCKGLIVVNSTVGALYRVDPKTGEATQIDLNGASVTMGDGLLLLGQTLYVVRNRVNEIVVFELSADLASGGLVDTITDPAFRVPTTIDNFGQYLYAVNARFDLTDPGPDTEYEVVQVSKE